MNFNRRLLLLLGVCFLLGFSILSYATVSNADLQKQYVGKVLTLRQFYPGKRLHFNATGKPAKPVAPGAWTVDGQVRVRNISLKDGVVHIRGQRLFLFFNPESKQLSDVGSLKETDTASKFFGLKKLAEWSAKRGKTEIDVECGVALPEMADVTRAMNAVFFAPEESLTEEVPDFWKTWFEPKKEPASGVLKQQDETTQPVKRVSPPRVTHSPDPEYTNLARQAKYQGTLVLWLLVDRNGLPQQVRIVKPLGMGLDEQAVNTVRTWKFDPAKRDGNPEEVQINVEVSFHLY